MSKDRSSETDTELKTEQSEASPSPTSNLSSDSSSESDLESTFDVHEEVARGGMGIIYRGFHRRLQRVCAIKVLQAVSDEDLALKRFIKEARIVCSFDHINIVKIFTVGVNKAKSPYFAMEWLDGQSLDSLMEKEGRMNIQLFKDIFSQVLSAVDYAHSMNIIHRDIKPSNIFLVKDESGRLQVKLLDFGIARSLEHSGAASMKLTSTGSLLGSPRYMSPEQCSSVDADQRTDIYSIAAVMYEAISGAPLFDGDNPLETMYKQINAKVDESKLPKDMKSQELNQCILKALAKDPDHRFQSVDEFSKSLQAALTYIGDEDIEFDDKLDDRNTRKRINQTLLTSAIALVSIVICAAIAIKTMIGANNHIDLDNKLKNKIESASTLRIRANGELKEANRSINLKDYQSARKHEDRAQFYYLEGISSAQRNIKILREKLAKHGKSSRIEDELNYETNLLHNLSIEIANLLKIKGQFLEAANACDTGYETSRYNFQLASDAARLSVWVLLPIGKIAEARKNVLLLESFPVLPKTPEGNENHGFWKWKSLNQSAIGQTFLYEGRKPEALNYFKKAMTSYQKTTWYIKDNGRLANIQAEIAEASSGSPEKIDEMFLTALKSAETCPPFPGDNVSVVRDELCVAAYSMLACASHFAQKQDNLARHIFEKTYDMALYNFLSRGVNQPLIATLRDWGEFEIARNKYSVARRIAKKGLEFWDKNPDGMLLSEIEYLLGTVDLQESALNKALGHFELALNNLCGRYPDLAVRIKLMQAETFLKSGCQKEADAIFLSLDPKSFFFKALYKHPEFVRNAVADCAAAFSRAGKKEIAEAIAHGLKKESP